MEDYAGLVQRAVALIIDQIIIGVALVVLIFAGVLSTSMSAGAVVAIMGVQWVLWLVYFTFFEGSSGQTIGKRFMNIRVISADGSDLSYAQAMVRSLLRIVDSLPTLYILGIILVIVTRERQRLGDMVAGSVVIRT
ncbi:MAG: RDD family protein [Candidatus Methanofastidiosa archaeon]|nr:RDD family protein [Candidatus Methanofastidiosa archaeon]